MKTHTPSTFVTGRFGRLVALLIALVAVGDAGRRLADALGEPTEDRTIRTGESVAWLSGAFASSSQCLIVIVTANDCGVAEGWRAKVGREFARYQQASRFRGDVIWLVAAGPIASGARSAVGPQVRHGVLTDTVRADFWRLRSGLDIPDGSPIVLVLGPDRFVEYAAAGALFPAMSDLPLRCRSLDRSS